MKIDIEILLATSEDALEISRLNDAVQKLHAANEPAVFKYPTVPSDVEDFFRKQIQTEDSFVFIALTSGSAIGYVWCTVQRKRESPFTYSQDRIYVHQLSVDPEYRQRGVGSRLMHAVDSLAKEERICCVALDSWAFNHGAHTFFGRLGFSQYNVNMWRYCGGISS